MRALNMLFIPQLQIVAALLLSLFAVSCNSKIEQDSLDFDPRFTLMPADTFRFNNFVDCNMAEAWVGDTFRIFPGKYGEDPLWGYSRELKFASGRDPDEAFSSVADGFIEPQMPPNAPTGERGLHGAAWFETVYQDESDATGKTLYAVYHNENYPPTLPYDAATGEGYIDKYWPQGLTGPESPAAVCRIGIMKSTDGGWSWENKGLFLEDKQPRMILKPHNTSRTFAGGVGDPSAVANGEYLYLFYGEYGFPGVYDSANYDPEKEWNGQCISVARIRKTDLDAPQGKALRWAGDNFSAPWDGIGKPIENLKIPVSEGGGAASTPEGGFHWGPSVSWNEYLECWVMLMAKVTGPSWLGSSLYISFNPNKDLGAGANSQAWTKPQLLVDKPGHTMWYPSLQPMNTQEDIDGKRTCLRLGREARLFYKFSDLGLYMSEYIVRFDK